MSPSSKVAAISEAICMEHDNRAAGLEPFQRRLDPTAGCDGGLSSQTVFAHNFL